MARKKLTVAIHATRVIACTTAGNPRAVGVEFAKDENAARFQVKGRREIVVWYKPSNTITYSFNLVVALFSLQWYAHLEFRSLSKKYITLIDFDAIWHWSRLPSERKRHLCCLDFSGVGTNPLRLNFPFTSNKIASSSLYHSEGPQTSKFLGTVLQYRFLNKGGPLAMRV